MNSAAGRGFIVPKISNRNIIPRPMQNMKRPSPASSASRSILERLSFGSHQPKLVRHADVCTVNNAGVTSEYQTKATDNGSSIEIRPFKTLIRIIACSYSCSSFGVRERCGHRNDSHTESGSFKDRNSTWINDTNS